MISEQGKVMQNSILLESGTNELEVLVFHVGAYRLGINVAKVREILPAQPITRLPSTHPCVLGCFRLREQVVPCISLHRKFRQGDTKSVTNFILTEFNLCQTTFLADRVERIYRISWERIQPVPEMLIQYGCPITGITELGGQLVVMLDFETIAAEVAQHQAETPPISNRLGANRESVTVVVADDSVTVRKAIEKTLRDSGYRQIFSFGDGRAAWNWLTARAETCDPSQAVATAVISDVEMPSMDGFHLTKKIKEHPAMQTVPVILYSSILTPDNQKKGEAVGADAQITKPELVKVVEFIDNFSRASLLGGNTQSARPFPSLSSPASAMAGATATPAGAF